MCSIGVEEHGDRSRWRHRCTSSVRFAALRKPRPTGAGRGAPGTRTSLATEASPSRTTRGRNGSGRSSQSCRRTITGGTGRWLCTSSSVQRQGLAESVTERCTGAVLGRFWPARLRGGDGGQEPRSGPADLVTEVSPRPGGKGQPVGFAVLEVRGHLGQRPTGRVSIGSGHLSPARRTGRNGITLRSLGQRGRDLQPPGQWLPAGFEGRSPWCAWLSRPTIVL